MPVKACLKLLQSGEPDHGCVSTALQCQQVAGSLTNNDMHWYAERLHLQGWQARLWLGGCPSLLQRSAGACAASTRTEGHARMSPSHSPACHGARATPVHNLMVLDVPSHQFMQEAVPYDALSHDGATLGSSLVRGAISSGKTEIILPAATSCKTLMACFALLSTAGSARVYRSGSVRSALPAG